MTYIAILTAKRHIKASLSLPASLQSPETINSTDHTHLLHPPHPTHTHITHSLSLPASLQSPETINSTDHTHLLHPPHPTHTHITHLCLCQVIGGPHERNDLKLGHLVDILTFQLPYQLAVDAHDEI